MNHVAEGFRGLSWRIDYVADEQPEAVAQLIERYASFMTEDGLSAKAKHAITSDYSW